MAEMVEFGLGDGPVPQSDAQQQQQHGGEQKKEKKGFSLSGALKKVAEDNPAVGATVNSAVNYLQGAAAQETGPWAAPGSDWPHEWNQGKEFWYPRAKKLQIAQTGFPNRTNKMNHHSRGNAKWATTDHYTLLGVWTRDCPASCFETVIGYLYPLAAVAICMQRKRLLLNNNENYECCAGLLGAKATVACNGCTSGSEDCCMFFEAFFCPLCALHGNRWLVQTHYGLEDTYLDRVVIDWGVLCRAPGECMCAFPECEEGATLLYLPFLGCIYAQHEYEMRTRGYPYLGQRAGDLAMNYHGRVKGCGYDGKVLVKKTLRHPHEPAME